MVFFTRDNVKKSELLLLLSDKYTSMSVALAGNGEWSEAAEASTQAEETFKEMLGAIKSAKEQGASPSEEFIQKTTLSNEKHKEVIQDLLITSPQGSRDYLQECLIINGKLRDELKSVKDR